MISIKKLNAIGSLHTVLPIVIIVGIAIIGTYHIVSSHADTLNSAITTGSSALTDQRQSCAHAHGPFNDSGNRVLDGQGNTFVPYGITVYGLSQTNWQSNIASDDAQINAMAIYWCANTVRIQAAPENLFQGETATSAYSSAYLSAIEGEVNLAFKDNLNVVLTAQTEHTGGPANPTAETLAYWQLIAKQYKGVGNIIFDLYNEPRLEASSTSQTWDLWKNGGTYQGTTYIGMQTLVTDLRQTGYYRTFWIEGPYYASTLSLVPQYLLSGSGLIYDVHHPAGPHNVASWQKDFGNLAETKPVVIGEWAQYASTADECWSDATTAVPQFLNYLQARHIGLVTWTLQPGVLIQNNQLNIPNNITSSYSCNDGNANSPNNANQNQGAGRLVARYFHANNVTP